MTTPALYAAVSAGSTALPASGNTTIAFTPRDAMPLMSEMAFEVLP